MIALAGSETKVEEYEQAIKLVGKAWGSDQSEVDKWLNLIQQERTAAAAAANGMPANHIMPERDLLLNWTGTGVHRCDGSPLRNRCPAEREG